MTIKRPLKELLSIDPDTIMDSEEEMASKQAGEESPATTQEEEVSDVNTNGTSGLCIECGDQPAELMCGACDEKFCDVCFGYLHRTGVS